MNNLFTNRRNYQEKYFWTFLDLAKWSGNDITPSYAFNRQDLYDAMTDLTSFSSAVLDAGEDDFVEEYQDLFDLICKRFKDHYCLSTNSDSLTEEDVGNFYNKLCYVAIMTSPKYLEMIKYYDDLKNELLSPVSNETENISRFNDTPQNGGDFADDSYTTNITQGTSKTKMDLDTPINRLEEINRKYRNLILDWSNEFNDLFIEEDNI